VVTAVISGLGARGMVLAFDALVDLLEGSSFPPATSRKT
jgi:hypothetical protein